MTCTLEKLNRMVEGSNGGSLWLKEKYTVREAIELTKGQYNSERFKDFFK